MIYNYRLSLFDPNWKWTSRRFVLFYMAQHVWLCNDDQYKAFYCFFYTLDRTPYRLYRVIQTIITLVVFWKELRLLENIFNYKIPSWGCQDKWLINYLIYFHSSIVQSISTYLGMDFQIKWIHFLLEGLILYLPSIMVTFFCLHQT